MLPFLEQRFCLFDQILTRCQCVIAAVDIVRCELEVGKTYPLLSWLSDVLVCLEQAPNVQRLATPEVSVDAPVEGELEGPPIKASASRSVAAYSGWGSTLR